jgi:chemotaxis signal transduction protein
VDPSHHSGPAAFRPGRYLTFRMAQREFAMEAERVRGILPLRELSELSLPAARSCTAGLPVPLQEWVRGIASLHGREFLVIDLAGKLRLPQPVHGRDPVILVAEVNTAQGLQLVGFIADRACDVIVARERDYRLGKLRRGGRPRIVLDPDIVLGGEPAAVSPIVAPSDLPVVLTP